MPESTTPRTRREWPQTWEKPFDDFPLCYHGSTGRLFKKVGGTRYYFGWIDDWQAALERYHKEKDDLAKGRVAHVPSQKEPLVVRRLLDHFIWHKRGLCKAGELSPRTILDYDRICKIVRDVLGRNTLVETMGPDDFAKVRRRLDASKWGGRRAPSAVAADLNRVRAIFNYGRKQGLIQMETIPYGVALDRPRKSKLRREQQNKATRLFTAEEIRTILAKSNTQMKALVLCGINLGYGNGDVGRLRFDHIDLAKKWTSYPREKTHVVRECPLWDETADAIERWLDVRPKPEKRAFKNLVFLTSKGTSWHHDEGSSPLSIAFARLLRPLGLYRKGRSFYSLRHTFRSVGSNAKDPEAVRYCMGHELPGIDAGYQHGMDPERLKDVVNVVRNFLWNN